MLKDLDLADHALWKQRFRAPKILSAEIANLNPGRGMVCTDRDGVMQLYAWDVTSGDLQQLTDQPTGVRVGLLSADGDFVYYLRDEGGNEIGHYVRVPFGGGVKEDITPDLAPYNSPFINQSFSGNLLGTRIADSNGFMLYVFAPGETPRQIYKSEYIFFGPSLSHNGEIAVIASTEGTNSMDTRLLALDLRNGEQIAELWDGKGTSHNLGDYAPRPGDLRILTSTSKSGYTRPLIWDSGTGVRRELLIDHIPGDVEAWRWSRDAKKVLLSQLDQAQRQLYLYDLETDKAAELEHPAGLVGSYFDNGIYTDENEILITWQDPVHPSRLIALDGSGKKKPLIVLGAGEVPDGRPWKSITYKSENGAQIHGWLAVPEGEGPFPTIFYIKGGPNSVMFEYYFPESQAWLDHGFAFFSINYHGSPTFGKNFEKAIVGQLGELEVQDIAYGYQWLVKNGTAQPEAVFLSGDSYGGYLTLLAIGKRPALWAGGMAGVAIADWTLLYEDENDALRGYQRTLFGGTPDEKPEAHKKSSPITYAAQIKAPILVIQGTNDSRCPVRQMQAYEAKLKSLGKQIDVHWFEAGHGSYVQEQQIEHQERRMRFSYQVLGKAPVSP